LHQQVEVSSQVGHEVLVKISHHQFDYGSILLLDHKSNFSTYKRWNHTCIRLDELQSTYKKQLKSAEAIGLQAARRSLKSIGI
jgi:hypothetical protein